MSAINKQISVSNQPVFVVERNIEAIRGDLIVDGASVLFKKGARVTVDELAFLLNEDLKDSESKSVRLANTIRLARMLPAVKDGDATVPAFDWVKDKVRAQIQSEGRSEGAFYTTFQLVEAIDVIEANSLKSSPTNVKDAMAALRKSEALPKGELKLKASKASALVKALKEGATQAKVREIVGKMGTTKKTKKSKTSTPPTDTTTTKVPQTIDGIKAAIVGARGQWELGVQEGLKIEEIRQACFDEVAILARLAGYELVQLKGPQPAKK